MKFFNPTIELKELILLQHIENNPDTTQKEIAEIISGAPSMVNVYINELETKKYLIRDYQSAKIVYYRITSEGIKRKNYLLISYMKELIDLYRLAKSNVERFLQGLEDKGYRNVLLYGAGEVAETIISVIRDREVKNLKVLALIDDDKSRQGKRLLGYKIVSREEINKYEHDGIVIASYTFEDNIRNRLQEMGYSEDRIERFFSE